LTALTKFDGVRMRQLSAREFHQIAGRAGRAGYDTAGTVVLQAPEHETENLKSVAKAQGDPKKLRKVVRKKAPDGFVSWGEPSFLRLIAAEPETLTSSMRVSHAMLLNVIARGDDAFAGMRRLLEDNHEPRSRQRELVRQALSIYRTLRTAEVVEQVDGRIRLTVDLQPNFALNQPLSPFALAVFDLLDAGTPGAPSPHYALDVISVLEATLDDPRPVLSAQQFLARGEAVAAMKAEGIDYDQRMDLLEEVTHPKPLQGLLGEAFEVYRASQPWVGDFELSPKTVVRDMYERAMTFNDYIGFYKLNRSEGLVLRYLSDAYRAARQTIPESVKTEELRDIIEWLGELVRQVDSSLLDEWEALNNPDALNNPGALNEPDAPVLPPAPASVVTNPRAFRVLVRNELFRRVQLAAREQYTELGELDAAAGFDADAWADAMEGYYRLHASLGTAADARSPAMLLVEEHASEWRLRQVFDDPAGDHDWGISATVDLAASAEQGVAVVQVTSVGQLGSFG
ncbi:MAG: DUF3516 domain-containing protein, partial [Microbacteriaceae bacterium]